MSYRQIERVTPGATEFGGTVARQLRTPGVRLAIGTALLATFALFGVGLVLAPLSQSSFLGYSSQLGFLTRALARIPGAAMVPTQYPQLHMSLRVDPGLLLVVTLAALAVAAYALSPSTRGLPDGQRLAWGAATGLPFGLMVLLAAVLVGTQREAIGGGTTPTRLSYAAAFFLALLWGGLGGAGGVALALRNEGRGVAVLAPWPRLGQASRLAFAALRPLGLALVVCAVLGTGAWLVQAVRDAGRMRQQPTGRASATAALDGAMYVADNGLHLFELGSGVSFHNPGVLFANGMPVPASKVAKITGDTPASVIAAATAGGIPAAVDPPGTFDIFDYRRGLPLLGFVLLLATMAIPVLTAVFAGFFVGRAAGARAAAGAAAWGSLVGPIWATAMVVLNAVVQKQLGGRASGDTVLVVYLLGGLVLGALGGGLGWSGPGHGAVFDR